MSRPRQPEEIAKLKGDDKKHPDRHRNIIPKSSLPLGEAPLDMSAEEKAAWFELSTYSVPGVMTGADRVLFELAASLLAEYRMDRQNFKTVRMTELRQILGRFGMSPADRSKLGVAKPKDENPYTTLDS